MKEDVDIEGLHQAVDELTAPLEALHHERLRCSRGCSDCCVDDISVFEVEADLIRRHHRQLLAAAEPHPTGACALLDPQGACRIYRHRPYVCRTQGLPIRWTDDEDGELLEYRDICQLNEPGPPITELEPEACWSIGPIEVRLQALQRRHGAALARVKLRELFGQASS